MLNFGDVEDKGDSILETETLPHNQDSENFDLPIVGPYKKVGGKPLYGKFPCLIAREIAFIKQHSFAAQSCRRKNTGTGADASLKQLKDHPFTTVPGLNDIGRDTMHH